MVLTRRQANARVDAGTRSSLRDDAKNTGKTATRDDKENQVNCNHEEKGEGDKENGANAATLKECTKNKTTMNQKADEEQSKVSNKGVISDNHVEATVSDETPTTSSIRDNDNVARAVDTDNRPVVRNSNQSTSGTSHSTSLEGTMLGMARAYMDRMKRGQAPMPRELPADLQFFNPAKAELVQTYLALLCMTFFPFWKDSSRPLKYLRALFRKGWEDLDVMRAFAADAILREDSEYSEADKQAMLSSGIHSLLREMGLTAESIFELLSIISKNDLPKLLQRTVHCGEMTLFITKEQQVRMVELMPSSFRRGIFGEKYKATEEQFTELSNNTVYLAGGGSKAVFEMLDDDTAVVLQIPCEGDSSSTAEWEATLYGIASGLGAVCPHFLQVKDNHVWSREALAHDKVAAEKAERYVYITVEKCHGTLSWLAQKLSTKTKLELLFQICYAVLVGTVHLGIRFRDLKTPNILLRRLDHATTRRYSVGNKIYSLRKKCEAVLTDFGTSTIGHSNFDLTYAFTLHLTPPEEFLLGGIKSVPGHHYDVYSLGLMFLELLDCGSCDKWRGMEGSKSFTQVVEKMLTDGHNHTYPDDHHYLAHFFYQELLLVGPIALEEMMKSPLIFKFDDLKTNYQTMMNALGDEDSKFAQDAQRFSLTNGAEWKKLRATLGTEGVRTLTKMLDWNPFRRPALRHVLQSPLFESMQVLSVAENQRNCKRVQNFMRMVRSEEESIPFYQCLAGDSIRHAYEAAAIK